MRKEFAVTAAILIVGLLFFWQACVPIEDDPGTGQGAVCDPANGDSNCNYAEYCAEIEIKDSNGFPTGEVEYRCTLRDTCDPERQDCPIGWYCETTGYCFKGTAPKPDNDTAVPDDTMLPDNGLPDSDATDMTFPDNDTAVLPDPDTAQPDTDTFDSDTVVPDTDTGGGTLDFTEGFEGGVANWTPAGDWQIGAPTAGPLAAHGGTNCAATNLSGNYSNGANAMLTLTTQLAIPGGAAEPVIEFYAYVDTEGTSVYMQDYVELLVKKQTDTWESATKAVFITGPSSLLDSSTKTKIGGKSESWNLFGASLTPFKGQTVQIAFRFRSDAEITASGIYIDDIHIH